jgi:hypothetical protein
VGRLPHPLAHAPLHGQQLLGDAQMQRSQEAPERALRRQPQDFQNAGQHWFTRHKPQVIQPGKPHVSRQHHRHHELVHGHRPSESIYGQRFLDQLLKPQSLQHGRHR